MFRDEQATFRVRCMWSRPMPDDPSTAAQHPLPSSSRRGRSCRVRLVSVRRELHLQLLVVRARCKSPAKALTSSSHISPLPQLTQNYGRRVSIAAK